jgi:UDP-N-acetylglucosamine---dolichyl-phosphate N-acetylglucosaminyltransferase
MKTDKKIYIVLPAFGEEKIIKSVIEDIKNQGYRNIIVVDDGSKDHTHLKAKETGIIVAQHVINRGKGAATQTGIDAALLLGAEIVVTMDSDGQHNPKEIEKLIEPLINDKVDVVIGSRMLNGKDKPKARKFMNVMANIITYVFFGVYVSDSQSGFRAYTRNALKGVTTHLDRYEFESEMLGQIKKQRIKEVPIKVIYSDHSYNKYKGIKNFSPQGLLNGIAMVVRLIENSLFK